MIRNKNHFHRFTQKAFEIWFENAPIAVCGFFGYGLVSNSQHYWKGSSNIPMKTLKILGSSVAFGLTGFIWPISLPVFSYLSYKTYQSPPTAV
jgi:hypothetical protein